MHKVEGWLTDDEAGALYRVARACPAPALAVEIGSWYGKSSLMIAGGIRAAGGGRLYAIDPFVGAEGHCAAKGPSEKVHGYLAQFMNNIAAAELERYVSPLRGYSHEILAHWAAPIDMLFIDGEHEYEQVKRDFETWAPFVRIQGYVAFHDTYAIFPGPTRLVEEQVKPPHWEVIGRADSLTVAHKIGDGGSGL
jgi:predicted O-methyltransferase YrrM